MLVSAIMPTAGRPEMAARAVQGFLAQMWPDKELVIVDDQKRPSFPNGIEHPLVRYFCFAGPFEIGGKRNLCCGRAAGEFIAHWDDDDYSTPDRLSDQLQRLTESGKAVTGYHSMRFTDGQRWWKYHGTLDYALGTSLCYRKDWWQVNKFPSLQVGEDNQFTRNAHAQRQLVSADAGELMYATIHPGNTSPRSLGSNWKLIAA
jgi:glycosyltransferase involved in cell wall biosynthesis